MSKFKEGTRVICIEKCEIRKGVVRHNYDDLGIAVVDFDEGTTEKVPLDMLAVEPEPVKAEGNVPDTEPTEKTEITITLSEFMEKASTVASKIALVCGKDSIPVLAMFCARLHIELFVDAPENE